MSTWMCIQWPVRQATANRLFSYQLACHYSVYCPPCSKGSSDAVGLYLQRIRFLAVAPETISLPSGSLCVNGKWMGNPV